MKTSMCPPHARPTSNATSSATPNAASLGSPLLRTFCASSNTAPSMHPLDTEPAILPERVISILEPSGRGLEPHVSTTVATAPSSPSRVADARAAAEVMHALAHRFERAIEVAVSEEACDSRQPRREHERLQVFAASDGVGKDHQQPRVPLHRTADVADQDKRPPPHTRLAAKQGHQLPAGADRLARRSPEVDAPAAVRPQAPRAPLGDPPWPLLEEPPHLLRLLPRHLFEGLVPQQ